MRQLLFTILFLCPTTIFAQDVIVKKDGSTILSKVLEVTQNDIKYKNFNNLDGPTYIISKSEIQAINYQNGMKDVFSEPVQNENKFAPSNQSDGLRKMNDNALLKMDYEVNNPYKQAQKLRTTGFVCGIPLLAAGTGLFIYGAKSKYDGNSGDALEICGGVLAAAGITCTTICLVIARSLTKEAQLIESQAILQKNINFKNGSTLTPRLDVIEI